MTIVFLPLRLSVATRYPLFPNPNPKRHYLLNLAVNKKKKLKAEKEAGIKPRKIPKKVEQGDDDCGEDLKGLGDVKAYFSDVPLESDSDDEELFLSLPAGTPADTHADVFSIIPALCYGRNNEVDMLELWWPWRDI